MICRAGRGRSFRAIHCDVDLPHRAPCITTLANCIAAAMVHRESVEGPQPPWDLLDDPGRLAPPFCRPTWMRAEKTGSQAPPAQPLADFISRSIKEPCAMRVTLPPRLGARTRRCPNANYRYVGPTPQRREGGEKNGGGPPDLMLADGVEAALRSLPPTQPQSKKRVRWCAG